MGAMAGDAPRAPAVAWHTTGFLQGLLYALPAAVAGVFSPVLGLALAVGVLPVAALPLPPRRRARRVLPLLGALSAGCFLIGSALAAHPVAAVAAMFGLGLGLGLWARDAAAGRAATMLCLPLIGIGLSFDEFGTALIAAALMIAGSLYAWLTSLIWPEQEPAPVPASPPAGAAERRMLLDYAFLLGATGATAAAVGFALDLEHVGWATAAALFVLRPSAGQLLLRSVGRAASVAAGALVAALLAGPGPAFGAIAAAAAIGAIAATRGSRWYVTPGFTTFVVLTLILTGPGERPGARVAERVTETAVGIGIALAYGILVPVLLRRIRSVTARRGAS